LAGNAAMQHAVTANSASGKPRSFILNEKKHE